MLVTYMNTVIILLIANNVTESGASVISQRKYGSIAVQLQPVYFQTAEWDAFFALDVVCVDQISTQSVTVIINKALYETATMLSKFRESINNSSKEFYSLLLSFHNTMHETQIEIYHRGKSIITQVEYIRSESQYLYGALTSSLCDQSKKYNTRKTYTPKKVSLYDINNDARTGYDRIKRAAPFMYDAKIGHTPNDKTNQYTITGNTNVYIEGTHHHSNINNIPVNKLDVAETQVTSHLSSISGSQLKIHKDSQDLSNSESHHTNSSYNRGIRHDDESYWTEKALSAGISKMKRDLTLTHLKNTSDTSTIKEAKKILKCYDRCGVLQHDFMLKYHINEGSLIDNRHNINTRTRRSVDEDRSTWFSRLTGTASSGEAKVLQDKIDLALRKLSTNDEQIISLQNNTMTLIHLMENSTESKLLEAMDKIDDISLSYRKLNSSVDTIKYVVDSHDLTTKLNILGTTINNLQLRTLTIFQDLEHQILEVRRFYDAIRSVYATKKFPFEIIPSFKVTQVLKIITMNLIDSMSVIPYDNLQQLLSNTPTNAQIHDNKIIIHLTIPIIQNRIHMQLWRVNTIPLFIDNAWMQFHLDHTYLIKNTLSNHWSSLTLDEYTQCISNVLRLCIHHPQWYAPDLNSCATSLSGIGGDPEELCILTPIPLKNVMKVYYTKIQYNEWLISLSNNNTSGDMSCLNIDTKDTVITPIQLSSYSKITLNQTCTLTVLGHRLSPDVFRYGSTTYGIENVLVNQNTSYKYEDLTQSIPHIIVRTIRSFDEYHDNSSVEILSRGATLAQIKKATLKNGKIYMTELDKYKDEERKLTNFIPQQPVFNFMFGSWWRTILSSFMILICVLIAILILLKCISSNISHTASIGIPLASNIQGSYANNISQNTLNNSMIPSVDKNISDTLENLTKQIHQNYQSLHIYMICHIIVMILVMLACHIMYGRLTKYLHTRTRLKLGYKPLNRCITHMPGESKLYVYFTVQIHSLFSNKPIYHEVVCQLCTIPGLAFTWSCDVTDKTGKLFKNQSSNRLCSYHTFFMQWGSLCLKSLQFPNMDTCRDLPKTLKLSQQEILCNHQASLPWHWCSLTPYSITKLVVEDEKNTNILYTFNMHYGQDSII
ncbi:MAG: hypothetical protein [Bat faecal associated chuvirus 2]|nr:MAG: hypothetical protein [Bat faecal associated chuvirus 2]